MDQTHGRIDDAPDPPRIRPGVFWTSLLVLTVVALWLLRDAILPFILAFVLAYLLEPIVHRLERWKMNRLAATLIVLAALVGVFVLILTIIGPPLAREFAQLLDRLPEYAARLQSLINEIVGRWVAKFGGWERLGIRPAEGEAAPSTGDLVGMVVGWGVAFLRSLLTGGQAALGALSLFVIAPIVSFYLLLDWRRMIARIDGWLPRAHQETIRRIAREIDTAIGRSLRGQALVCLFLALWYGIGLMLAGLNFGFLIGLTSGLLSIIPYVGSFVGLTLAMLVAIAQFWPDWPSIFIVLAVFASGQFLESYFLTPKVVGEAVGLHPVWLMFAVFAFGALFGFAGVILALPLAAAAGVLARNGLKAYLASHLYASDTPDAAP